MATQTDKGKEGSPKPGNTQVQTISIWVVLLLLLLWAIYTIVFPPPPEQHPQIESGIPLPPGAEPCEKGSPSALGYSYTCPLEIAGVTLQVGNVPSGVSPYLVPISEEQKAEYQQMPRDGFECVPSIFGNLVFAGEPESGTTGLVTIFKSPIELKLNYNSSELAELDGCEIGEDEEAVLLPVFLYTFEEDESSFSVWKPFQNYEADQDSANVKFKVWGDPPIGVTLRRAPKDWGPP